MAETIKKRGEVYRINIDDAQGNEQKGDNWGNRLAVIVSNDKQNAIGNLIVVVPLTSNIKKILPFQVATFFQRKQGKAKCEQVRALTIERFGKRLGTLTEKEINEIEEKLVIVLNLETYMKRKFKEWIREMRDK